MNKAIWALILVGATSILLGQEKDEQFAPYLFTFPVLENLTLPDPEHTRDGRYEYSFPAHVFPENAQLDAASAKSDVFLQLLSQYFEAAKAGDVESIIKLYNPESVDKFREILGDPEASKRLVDGLMSLQGYKPAFVVKVDEGKYVLFGYPIRRNTIGKNLLPFLLLGKDGVYTLAAGGFPDSLPLKNLNNYTMTKALNGLELKKQ